jgi:hypothetical protein
VTTRALITGAEPLAGAVAAALRQAGVEVVVTEDVQRVAEAVAGLEPGSVDTYVQLPISLASRGDTVVARVRQFLSEGLLARFQAVEAVLPVLAPGAHVLLVPGTTPLDAGDLPDDRRARLALLEVLAHAVRADGSASRVRVRVHTVSSGRGADELAAVALGRGGTEPAAVADLQAREPEMSYEDWRTEVLGLATVEV